MPVIFVFAIGVIIIASLNMAFQPVEETLNYYRTKLLQHRLERLGEAMINRYEENPASGFITPANLPTTAGYEYLRLDSPQDFQAQSAPTVSDSVWRFTRMAVWFESPYNAVGNAAYVSAAENTCGTGSFATATSWCGRSNSIWMKVETRESHSTILLGEKQRLVRTIAKFGRRYAKDQTFTPLAVGTARTMPQLVGYAGTAPACSGVYSYNDIPFTCDDLFNMWGIPISFNQVTANHIALVNRTQITNSSGALVRLAEEMKLE